jgi:hypothetical protein
MIPQKNLSLSSTLIIISSFAGLILSGCMGFNVSSQAPESKNSTTETQSKNAQVKKQDQPVSPFAEAELPFVGTRYFNFWGGNGTGQSITIEEDGTTIIQLHGTQHSSVQYRGHFANRLKLDDGQTLLIKEDEIYLLAKDGEIEQGCNGDDQPCVSKFYEPSAPSILDGFYAIGGTDQGLEVSGSQYRYYDELGEQEWRPIAELTAIEDGLVYDGKLYWCIPPEAEAGVCTEKGWKSAQQALAENSERREINESELTLGDIALGDAKSKLIRRLGEPVRRSINPVSVELEYEGLSFSLDEQEERIWGMESRRADYCTPSGLCPEMTVAEAENIYGTATISDREDGRFLEYYNTQTACWLKIGVSDDIIKSVAIACQP